MRSQNKHGARPKVRSVLLDASFINALLAVDASQHAVSIELYSTLVDRYQRGLDRLFALSTVLGDLPREFRRSALAPVTTVRVARQHRSAARAVVGATSEEMGLSLVMMRRERIRVVATVTDSYAGVDVQVLDFTNIDPAEAAASAPLEPDSGAPADSEPVMRESADVE